MDYPGYNQGTYGQEPTMKLHEMLTDLIVMLDGSWMEVNIRKQWLCYNLCRPGPTQCELAADLLPQVQGLKQCLHRCITVWFSVLLFKKTIFDSKHNCFLHV